MSCFAATRCVARSAGRTSSAARLAGKSKPSSSSTFSVPKTLNSRSTSFRSAMESSRCLNSMLPFHSATASSLLISMLSVSNPIYSWTIEVLYDECPKWPFKSSTLAAKNKIIDEAKYQDWDDGLIGSIDINRTILAIRSQDVAL